jgi:hypothetical protein
MLTPRQMTKMVRTPDGHLFWTGGLANGYPAVRYEGKTVYAKRLIWEKTHGPIPEGAVVISTCSNRACIEPSHLGLSTPGRHGAPKDARGKYASEPEGAEGDAPRER